MGCVRLVLMDHFGMELALLGHNIFISGQAGVGKTFLLSSIVKALEERGRKVATTASTGIATTQLKGGVTLHSWAGIKVCIQSIRI